MVLKQVDNPEISARFHKETHESQQEYSQVAQYLMGRAHQDTFFVTIGQADIEVRVPTRVELMRLTKLQADVWSESKRKYSDDESAVESIQFIAKVFDEIFTLLDRLCIDESLDYQFFSMGLMSDEDIAEIIEGILKYHNTKQEKIGKFRKK